jgi:hypothetical protein
MFFSFFYITAEPLPSTFFGWLYLLVSWVGHFAFLSLSGFLLLVFPIITLFPYFKHIRGISAILAALVQLLLFLDVLAFRGLGYHLSATSFQQLSEVEDVYVSLLGNGYWLLTLAVFGFVLAFEFVASNFTWRRVQVFQQFRYKNQLATGLVLTFFLSHAIHIWADATLNSDIAKQSSMFPASYPMTAKTLLARYELIDLQKLEQGRFKLASIEKRSYILDKIAIPQCDTADLPNLKIQFLSHENLSSVRAWLSRNNVQFQQSNQLNLATDMNTSFFNFATGLPGLYQTVENQDISLVNNQLNQQKISISLAHGNFDINQPYSEPRDKRLFVFFDPTQKSKFYRTSIILTGFPEVGDHAFAPQNIIATYLSEVLDCPEYVENNLLDSGYTDIKQEGLLTNYTQGYLSIIYKDKSMLFYAGQLIENQTFSTGVKVVEPLDLKTVQTAIDLITSKRKNITK